MMAAESARKTVGIVVAATRDGGIGKDGSLPWKLKSEMAHFTKVTSTVQGEGKRNAVIMGRKTWESIPSKFRPLKNRLNIVLTSKGIQDDDLNDLKVVKNIDAALAQAESDSSVESSFVIGGAGLIADLYSSPKCTRVYLTKILKDFDCDVHIPELDMAQWKLSPDHPVQEMEENDVPFEIHVYDRV